MNMPQSLFIEAGDWFKPLKWDDYVPTNQPIEVDRGAGDGGFLVERARVHPNVNFLAVERLLGRARKIDKKARRLALTNLRVLRMESLYAVRWLFPSRSIRTFHLLFPDPWPKKKHHKHRIIRAAYGEPRQGRGDFLGAIESALEPGGNFFSATDHGEYFAEIFEAFKSQPGWEVARVEDKDWFEQKTDFEIEFQRLKAPIQRLRANWKD